MPWVPNPTEAERPSEEEFEPEPEKQVYPLHQAAADGDIEQVKLLISKGANVNAEDEEKKTPLHYAAETGKMEVVKLFVEAGADINAGEGKWTVLHGAVYEGRRDIAELLIQKGADVNIKDRNGHQPLFNAIWKKDLDTLKLLINKGANVNIVEAKLKDIVSPFLRNVSTDYLNLSPNTISFYRKNTRRKFGINNKQINLNSYLSLIK